MIDPKEVTFYDGPSGICALYIGDKLEAYGDRWWVTLVLLQQLGVAPIPSDEFLRGGSQSYDAANTLREVYEYRHRLQIDQD